MHYEIYNLWLLTLGLFLVIVGSRGIIKRQISARGRTGPARTYVGREAVWRGAFSIVVGLVVIALSFANLN